jgi:hypothetical protein
VQDLIITAPSVVYRCGMKDGEVIEVANPSVMPDASKRDWIEEPFVKIEMITPKDYVGSLMEVSQSSFARRSRMAPAATGSKVLAGFGVRRLLCRDAFAAVRSAHAAVVGLRVRSVAMAALASAVRLRADRTVGTMGGRCARGSCATRSEASSST